MDLVSTRLVISLGGDVDELENEWPSGYDARTAGKKVAADDVLEDGGFARGLGADDHLRVFSYERVLPLGQNRVHTICGRSSESLPMVLKTRSWSLLTTVKSSSPSAAMVAEV